MRIVLIGQGSLGDVRPLCALGCALKAANHEVIACAPPGFSGLFERHGMGFAPSGVDPEQFFKAALGEGKQPTPTQAARLGIRLITEILARQFETLPAAAQGASLLIGAGLDYAGRTIAQTMGVPYRMACFIPTAFRSSHHPPMVIPYRQLPRWVNRLLWWFNALSVKMSIGGKLNAHRRKLGLPKVSDFYEYMAGGAILAADEDLAPLPADCAVVSQTPYWHLDDPAELDSRLVDFIEAGPAPVYLGFGSCGDARPDSTRKLLSELVASRAFRLVVSRGSAGLEVDETQGDALVVDGVPHAKLFPRMAAVVHHGGAGTTHTAALAGTPQVIVPHALDQFYWGARVQALGLGPIPISRTSLTARNLLAAIESATAQPVRDCAARLRDRLAPRRRSAAAVELIEASAQ